MLNHQCSTAIVLWLWKKPQVLSKTTLKILTGWKQAQHNVSVGT